MKLSKNDKKFISGLNLMKSSYLADRELGASIVKSCTYSNNCHIMYESFNLYRQKYNDKNSIWPDYSDAEREFFQCMREKQTELWEKTTKIWKNNDTE